MDSQSASKVTGLLLCLLVAIQQPVAGAACGASPNPTGNPIGGGEGYSLIPEWTGYDYTYSVSSVEDLLDSLVTVNSLSSPTLSQLIFIEGDSTLNLSTVNTPLNVPSGVTISSDRGKKYTQYADSYVVNYQNIPIVIPRIETQYTVVSPGALLYTNTDGTKPLFKVTGNNVRFTSLRLQGPSTDVGEDPFDPPVSQGISAGSVNDLAVDNSELFGWTHAAIRLRDTASTHIHHNHIHHNRRTGFGYGVSTDGTSGPLVEANLFVQNRHDIAGTGEPELGYEARYNIAFPATSHNFDMHGEHERYENGSLYAGSWLNIHHNTFYASDYPSIKIRGKPRGLAVIDQNDFLNQSNEREAVVQFNTITYQIFPEYENVYFGYNCYK